jgi:hypothetical protein|tara:strand:- start:396 stop:626 length:231 start_codon:yes stop_codon:yes gene_type:complete
MFKAILLICSLISGFGDKNSCIELHDTIAPNGYATEDKCMIRIHEMADMVSQSLPFPYHIKYKCENNIQRTEYERK